MLDPTRPLKERLLPDIGPRSTYCGRNALSLLSLFIGLGLVLSLSQMVCTYNRGGQHLIVQKSDITMNWQEHWASNGTSNGTFNGTSNETSTGMSHWSKLLQTAKSLVRSYSRTSMNTTTPRQKRTSYEKAPVNRSNDTGPAAQSRGEVNLTVQKPTIKMNWQEQLMQTARAWSFLQKRASHEKIINTRSDDTDAAVAGTVRVVTYNVLSSHLADEDYFRHCKPEDLNATTRLQRVIAKLEPEVAKGAVVGLQEVSMTWAGPLTTWFAQRGYHLVLSLYGKEFNNYMGVGLGIPIDKYEVESVDISRLSDTCQFPEPHFGPILGPLHKIFVKWPVGLFHVVTRRHPQQSDWVLARKRFNSILHATLRDKSNRSIAFGISTYHMPCMFDRPRVMTMHAQLAARYTQIKSGNLPTVLMGDFNLKPGDGGYQLITQGNLPAKDKSHPGKLWDLKLSYPMASAYKIADGVEPDFTNYAQVENNEPFIDTLDYIFLSPGVEVAEVLPLPRRNQTNGPFPICTEPSDHIMIAATLRIGAA